MPAAQVAVTITRSVGGRGEGRPEGEHPPTAGVKLASLSWKVSLRPTVALTKKWYFLPSAFIAFFFFFNYMCRATSEHGLAPAMGIFQTVWHHCRAHTSPPNCITSLKSTHVSSRVCDFTAGHTHLSLLCCHLEDTYILTGTGRCAFSRGTNHFVKQNVHWIKLTKI